MFLKRSVSCLTKLKFWRKHFLDWRQIHILLTKNIASTTWPMLNKKYQTLIKFTNCCHNVFSKACHNSMETLNLVLCKHAWIVWMSKTAANNVYLQKINFDTAKNNPSKVCYKGQHVVRRNISYLHLICSPQSKLAVAQRIYYNIRQW